MRHTTDGMLLTGKVALVTGGSRGIGFAVARGKRLRDGRAKVAGADDGNGRHAG